MIPVDPTGAVTPEALLKTLTPRTRLVAIMMVNNEVGTLNDIEGLTRIVRRECPRARVLVDAVQGFGKVPFSVRRLGIDALAVTAHKIHGPKGVALCGHLENSDPF